MVPHRSGAMNPQPRDAQSGSARRHDHVVHRMIAVLAVLAAGTRGGVLPAAAAHATTPRRRPNILFALTDDLDAAELRFMPHTRRLIGAHGVTFDNYFVSNSLCCPSRVTTLRGQYSHNTGVWSNGGSDGGFERAFAEGIEQDTVATRLDHDGYRTALVGKYLNGYPNIAGATYRPPGWTTWVSPVGGSPYSEYNYLLNDNGRFVFHRRRTVDYGTTAYLQRTQHFIRVSHRAGKPFFAYLAPYAPHQPATPAPIDRAKFPNAHAPRTAAFDQPDVHAMPRFVRDLPRFSRIERAAIDDLYRLRIRSLQAVDRGVSALVHTLRVTRQLNDTFIVFTSDNGFHLGQHRLPAGKQTAYDTDTHVPLLIRGPGIPAHSHVSQLAGNVDLAPTFEAMAGAAAPSSTDGRSLLALARGNARAAENWRHAYIIEHRDEEGAAEPAPPRRHTPPLEPPDPDQRSAAQPRLRPSEHGHTREPRDARVLGRHAPIPDYDAVRTLRYLYVQYENGDRELYDTRADPAEIHNLAGTRPTLERALAARLAALRNCRGRGCRVADSSLHREARQARA
jgi:N-acetylglucosamine-6-sulfatase